MGVGVGLDIGPDFGVGGVGLGVGVGVVSCLAVFSEKTFPDRLMLAARAGTPPLTENTDDVMSRAATLDARACFIIPLVYLTFGGAG